MACKLGMGLSVLIDILNPEIIIIGSIFARQEQVLRGRMEQIIRQEALERNAQICRISPPALGEKIGDYAAVTVGLMKYCNQ